MTKDVCFQSYKKGTLVMDDFLEMKGLGRNVITAFGDGNVVRLMRYSDGSWSILRNGKLCGLWETRDEENCLKAFIRHSGQDGPITAVILAKQRSLVSAADPLLN